MKENYIYPATIKHENGLVQLTFIDLPNAGIAEADTEDEAIHSAQECLALEIMDMESRGEKLPDPVVYRVFTDRLPVPDAMGPLPF